MIESFNSHSLGEAHHCQVLAKTTEIQLTRLPSNTTHFFLVGSINQLSLLVVDVSICVHQMSLAAQLWKRIDGEESCHDVCFGHHDHSYHFKRTRNDMCESIIGDDDSQKFICLFFDRFVALACVNYLETHQRFVIIVNTPSLLNQKACLFIFLLILDP